MKTPASRTSWTSKPYRNVCTTHADPFNCVRSSRARLDVVKLPQLQEAWIRFEPDGPVHKLKPAVVDALHENSVTADQVLAYWEEKLERDRRKRKRHGDADEDGAKEGTKGGRKSKLSAKAKGQKEQEVIDLDSDDG